jgi:prepilin-type N-terminal cleavage/methylation domain-containing protein
MAAGGDLERGEKSMPATPTAGRPQTEAGFTLIELSIVLIIIGLLIGGVLQGQQLINGTRIKTQVSQIDGLRAAVNTFQDKYLALPGDATAANFIGFVAATGGGARGNGLVGTNGSIALTANVNAAAGNEPSVALEHLSLSGLVAGAIDVDRTATTQFPGKLSSSRLSIATFAFTNADSTAGARLGFRVAGGTGYTATPIATDIDAAEMDVKYDDGTANSGIIQAAGNGCQAAGVYATNGTQSCTLHFAF